MYIEYQLNQNSNKQKLIFEIDILITKVIFMFLYFLCKNCILNTITIYLKRSAKVTYK